jgi:hypothetical protein
MASFSLVLTSIAPASHRKYRRLHAADYQLITPSGRSFSRDHYLRKIESRDRARRVPKAAASSRAA